MTSYSLWTGLGLAVGLLCAASGAPVSAGSFGDGAAAYSLQNYAKAVTEWRPLAEAGNPQAQFRLGDLYESGRGVARDPALAAQWYERAARSGQARAALRLGDLYRQGHGVAGDAATAVRWYARAAEAGEPSAAYRLAKALAAGNGVSRDLITADAWLRIAECRFEIPSKARQAAAARHLLERHFSAHQMASSQAKREAILAERDMTKNCADPDRQP